MRKTSEESERTDLFKTELQNVADGVQARHEYVMVVIVKEKEESLPKASPSLARPTRTNQAAWTTISRLARSLPGTCRYRWIYIHERYRLWRRVRWPRVRFTAGACTADRFMRGYSPSSA